MQRATCHLWTLGLLLLWTASLGRLSACSEGESRAERTGCVELEAPVGKERTAEQGRASRESAPRWTTILLTKSQVSALSRRAFSNPDTALPRISHDLIAPLLR